MNQTTRFRTVLENQFENIQLIDFLSSRNDKCRDKYILIIYYYIDLEFIFIFFIFD